MFGFMMILAETIKRYRAMCSYDVSFGSTLPGHSGNRVSVLNPARGRRVRVETPVIRDPTGFRFGADEGACHRGHEADHHRDRSGAVPLYLSSVLAADLGLLSLAVQDADDDLATRLQSFDADLRGAVSSYLGLTVTIALDEHEIAFSMNEHADEIRTSLRIPLTAVAGNDVGSSVVLYAAVAGAFVDLAADIGFALAMDASRLLLDEHLVPRIPVGAIIGLRAQATINRAIGVLIERGYTPEWARAELRGHARAGVSDMVASAQYVLDGLAQGP
jgi:hypothetical protein